MIELQEDEVDDHDTSTIDEVSFPANLSFASYLKMAKNTATSQTNKLKKHGKLDKKQTAKNIANQPKKKCDNMANNTNTWETKPNKQTTENKANQIN